MSELMKAQESLESLDMYFNDEVVEFLNQHSLHILTIEPINMGKTFEPSFRVLFIKFSGYGRFSDSFLAELSELNRMGEKHLLLPFLSKNIEFSN